jgi:hypothetical protein
MYEKKFEAAKSVKEESLSINLQTYRLTQLIKEENDNNTQVQYLEQFL